MVLRFGLFPYCLNALQMFFCRSCGPAAVLRSDPSVTCWDGAHLMATGVGAAIFIVCGILTPLLLLRALKRAVEAQKRDGSLPRVSDTNEDVSMATAAHVELLTSEEKARYTRAFVRYDRDGNGSIDQKEMLHLLEDQTGKMSTDSTAGFSWRQKCETRIINKMMSDRSVEEMRGWMGLTADEDVSLDSFLRMLERMKSELVASVHNQQCVFRSAPGQTLCLIFESSAHVCVVWYLSVDMQ